MNKQIASQAINDILTYMIFSDKDRLANAIVELNKVAEISSFFDVDKQKMFLLCKSITNTQWPITFLHPLNLTLWN